ncbi:MAG TPA: InlB B-repeat-containing protein [Candidatus Izemoplasmatales bacterium]|nr:InlB B-repeat-containing protein [Candidatus Izemoplasmatales bacterium]
MLNRKRKWLKMMLAGIALVLTFVLTGCSGSTTTDIADTLVHTVIYDGNGGFLGNKTNIIRKLQVADNSKIPKYLSDYAQDPYVVSSLGLATRQGYLLKGWYLEENATYQASPTGAFVYLDLEDGNGLYSLNPEGEYVFGYVENLTGTLIFISVQEIPADIEDPDLVEYIYYQGTNGWGFYVFNADDAEMVAVKDVDGSYTPAQVSKYGDAYLVYEELSAAEKTLFAEIKRFNQEFYLYTQADEGLDRYSLDSGYDTLDNILGVDPAGEYVKIEGAFVVYDADNAEHDGLTRYSINKKYVFTPTLTVLTPSDLTRYDATILYWNFEENRVTGDLTLKAHWVKKSTVNFIQKSGQITSVTTKLNEEKTNSIDLMQGETIGKIETVPVYPGYTFIAWSTSATEYQPWNFETDVFPFGADVLNLYAFMLEGTYTRITSASGLAKVVQNPSGNYVLVNDIDLGGQTFVNSSPLGLPMPANIRGAVVPFTGNFVSFGYSISNFTLRVRNPQKELDADSGFTSLIGLFPYVRDAHIEGLVVSDVTILIENSTTGSNVILDLGGSGLVGTVLAGTELTEIIDCHVDVTFTATTANVLTVTVYVAEIVAKGTENATITECDGILDYSAITGITSGTLLIVTQ